MVAFSSIGCNMKIKLKEGKKIYEVVRVESNAFVIYSKDRLVRVSNKEIDTVIDFDGKTIYQSCRRESKSKSRTITQME